VPQKGKLPSFEGKDEKVG